MLVIGPTGAGKSVLLALMALQFRRYRNSQVFVFDFGGSIRAAALAMGGDWHDLGGGLTEGDEFSVALQPLARIHDTYERAWAADWIVAILMREGVPITPEAKEHIWTALTSLASAPVEERTITGLAVLLQSNDLKQALRPFCVGGAYGRLLDAEAEHLGSADVQAFEIEGLVGTGAAPAVLAYLFHRIGDRLDRHPACRLAHRRAALVDGRSDAMPFDQAVLAARDRETPAPHRLHLAVAHAGQVGAHDIGGGLEHPFLVCESLRVEVLAPWPTALGIDRDRRVHAADLYPQFGACLQDVVHGRLGWDGLAGLLWQLNGAGCFFSKSVAHAAAFCCGRWLTTSWVYSRAF